MGKHARFWLGILLAVFWGAVAFGFEHWDGSGGHALTAATCIFVGVLIGLGSAVTVR